MKNLLPEITQADSYWQSFFMEYQFTEHQCLQFQRYCDLLLRWNKVMDLTAVTPVSDIISHHFQDSLAVTKFVHLNANDYLCDVGSGAGFPGIPLKIVYPHLPMILIEVLAKRVEFLRAVIDELGLEGITISTLDWRTFLRTTSFPITYFCARASLRPDELIRIFKPNCPYRGATLLYWASDKWVMGQPEAPFFLKEASYMMGAKRRRLVFFAQPGQAGGPLTNRNESVVL